MLRKERETRLKVCHFLFLNFEELAFVEIFLDLGQKSNQAFECNFDKRMKTPTISILMGTKDRYTEARVQNGSVVEEKAIKLKVFREFL